MTETEAKYDTGNEGKTEIRPMIGIVCGEKYVMNAAFLNFMAIAQRGYHVVGAHEGPTILVRNALCQLFLKSPLNFTHILMLDSDMLHPLDILPRLAKWVTAPEQPKIINGLHYQRSAPYRPCAFKWETPDETDLLTITQWPKDSLMQVDATGGGSLFIAREVLETIPYPWFEMIYTDDGNGGKKFVGEDILFSKKAERYGFQVWVDTGVTSPHLGELRITESTFRRFVAEEEAAGRGFASTERQVIARAEA